MTDYSELKQLAEALREEASDWQPTQANFYYHQALRDPTTVLALIAENERLKKDVEDHSSARLHYCGELGKTLGDVDQLKSELKSMTVQRDSAIDLAILRKRERDEARAEVDQCAATLPGVAYMDVPDGGAPTIAEQLSRMAKDARRYQWVVDNPKQACAYLITDLGQGLYMKSKVWEINSGIDAAMSQDASQ